MSDANIPEQPMNPPQPESAGSPPPPPAQPYGQPAPAYGQPAPGAQPQYAAPAAPLSAESDKQAAMWAHIGGVIGFLPSLIIWLVLKDRGPRTNVEAKEALNWQITFTIGYVVLWIVVSILSGILFLTPAWPISGILWLLPFAWWVLNVVWSIMGGVKVNSGGSYRYPFSLRLIK